MKEDKGKPRPSLIYYSFIKEIVKVREHGIKKYGHKEDWRNTENYDERYLDAIFRHIFSYAEGEYADKESGLSHLAHAACDIMFLIEGENNKITVGKIKADSITAEKIDPEQLRFTNEAWYKGER